jgi:hypothetical protein
VNAWPFAKSARSFKMWPAYLGFDTDRRSALYETDSTVDEQSGPPAPKKRVGRSAGSGKRERTRYSRYAQATFRKDRRLTIRLSSKDLEAIQKRALAEGCRIRR